MPTSSSLGIGTGVDLQSMLTSILAAEKAPITALETKITATNSKISLYGQLNSKLDSLRTASNTLQFPSQLAAITAKSSDTTVLGANASFFATPGSYAVNVTQLAKAQKNFSYAYDPNTSFGQGQLRFKVGGVDQTPIDLTDQASYTLQEVKAKINDANIGVTATVISGTNGDRLILTGNKTGAANNFSFTTTIAAPNTVPPDTVLPIATQPALTDFDSAPALASSVAQDAEISIDGVSVASDTNTFSNSVAGLTFSAVKIGTSNVTVQSDSTKITDAVQKFVDAYNGVVSIIQENSTYNFATKTGKGFNGDSSARSVLEALGKARTTVPTELATATLKTMSELGVSIQQNGKLSLDTNALSKAISSSATDVTTAITAYGKSLGDAITGLTNDTGAISNRVSSLNSSISSYKDRQTALEIRVAMVEKRYRAQFTALDTMMSKMTTTSSYLSQQLANL